MAGKTYELGGREVVSFRECLEIMLRVVGREKVLLPLPFSLASLIGSVASLVPFVTPPLTSDQVTLLKKDNVVSSGAIAEGLTLEGMGITPSLMESILPSYLVQYRPHGQFTGTGKAA